MIDQKAVTTAYSDEIAVTGDRQSGAQLTDNFSFTG